MEPRTSFVRLCSTLVLCFMHFRSWLGGVPYSRNIYILSNYTLPSSVCDLRSAVVIGGIPLLVDNLLDIQQRPCTLARATDGMETHPTDRQGVRPGADPVQHKQHATVQPEQAVVLGSYANGRPVFTLRSVTPSFDRNTDSFTPLSFSLHPTDVLKEERVAVVT